MYAVGEVLICTGYVDPRKTRREGSFIGEQAVVFNSRKYGFGVRFKSFNYGDDDDPIDMHVLTNFKWEPLKKKGLVGFLRRVEGKDSS